MAGSDLAPDSTASSRAIRQQVVDRLREDLIGPRSPDELLQARPSDVWLTGILWPQNTALPPEEDERLAVAGDGESVGEDADDQARPAAFPMRRPSTAGLSFAVRSTGGGAPVVMAAVSFGIYEPQIQENGKSNWLRKQIKLENIRVEIGSGWKDIPLTVAEVAGLRLNVRGADFPGGRLVTITLVNGATPAQTGRQAAERVTLFQVGLTLKPAAGTTFVARPSRRAPVDEDDYSAALLYRDAREYAAGHTCSADWTLAAGSSLEVESLQIVWLPVAETPAVSGDGHSVFRALKKADSDPLSASWLCSASPNALATGLESFCAAYGAWIELQEQQAKTLDKAYAETADRHLREAKKVLQRMRSGMHRLHTDPAAATAFRLANLAMQTQSYWKDKSQLRWRPFQLGFLLLSLESAIDGGHADRSVMDLLWFPTGGGKTEAYLGLIAMVAFHRRLSRKDPDKGAGVAAIMRYTLRLLTTQQFIRAAAMMAACEAIRRGKIASPDAKGLGQTPFSVGLWVGDNATPNKREDAFKNKGNKDLSSPRQLVDCPCCHKPLDYQQATGNDPVTVWCRSQHCVLAERILPVWTVDEDVYDQRPTLLIGTVDKFAQIVRNKRTASLFAVGSQAQPQLILQDELHLIAGPLGTLTGLYESALDVILSADGTKPKIIGSTATIRRAADQVLGLFDRETCQFPPPGLDAADSGFAVLDHTRPGRLYVGATTAGRSAKFALQAVAASLLQTAGSLDPESCDPYWTLVTYFNSLRELGGALVLFQDDVGDSIQQLAAARSEPERPRHLIQELTSRRSQREIRDLLKELDEKASDGMALDAVLATNMLSVGVDIPRLGLMLVNGQPKTMAEYIQSTSRVGRGKVAGLVVPVLNAAKPRDRSHYETFRTWHATLYRDVEATSVTPYASRARDRALHAVLVAIIRHCVPGMIDTPAIDDTTRARAGELIELIAARAKRIDELETDVRQELLDRLDRWIRMAPAHYWRHKSPNISLLQGAEDAAAMKAAGHKTGRAWPTPNSMRGVEPVTPYRLVEFLKGAPRAS